MVKLLNIFFGRLEKFFEIVGLYIILFLDDLILDWKQLSLICRRDVECKGVLF